MPTKDYPVRLDDEGLEWLRVRFTVERGQVISFLVRYETTIVGKRVPVARYDGVHGSAHRDLLNQEGELIDKWWLPENLAFAEALTIGLKDLRENWRGYRETFFEGRS